jgi:hypothetical protein
MRGQALSIVLSASLNRERKKNHHAAKAFADRWNVLQPKASTSRKGGRGEQCLEERLNSFSSGDGPDPVQVFDFGPAGTAGRDLDPDRSAISQPLRRGVSHPWGLVALFNLNI